MNIVVTNRETCKDAYIPAEDIVRIEERKEQIKNRIYPFSRIFVENDKLKQAYTLDVVESEKWIRRLIGEAEEAEKYRKNGKLEEKNP